MDKMSSPKTLDLVNQSTSTDTQFSRKRSRSETVNGPVDDVDLFREEGMLCPVCLDAWTSSGPHRLCSLKCGHLFGLCCVEKWLGLKKRTCPSCNESAKKKDIREIYAGKLVVLDTTEVESLKKENCLLKTNISTLNKQLDVQKSLVQYYHDNYSSDGNKLEVPNYEVSTYVLPMKSRVEYLSDLKEGSCRVLAYNWRRGDLVVAQQNPCMLWQGFGIRQILNNLQRMNPLVPTNKLEIRDMSFSPSNDNLLLIVSLDKSLKVYDISSNKVIFNWVFEHRLWSCSWDAEESSVAYVGTEKGYVYKIDVVNISAPILLPFPKEIKPVAVVSLISSRNLGCILCCRLLSVMVYFKRHNRLTESFEFDEQLLFEGRFAAMVLSDDGVLVLTTRPTSDLPQVRHLSYQLEVVANRMEYKPIQIFAGGSLLTHLSRTTLLRTPTGLFFFAFNESAAEIIGWCVGQHTKIASISCLSYVRDMLAIYRNGEILLLSLNDDTFRGIVFHY